MLSKARHGFIIASLVLMAGCVQVLTAEQTAPEINKLSTHAPIAIAVLDKRPYVVDGTKPPAFEGLIRSAVGIPYAHTTPTREAMSTYLSNRLSIGFANNDIEVNIVKTKPTMSVDSVIRELEKKESRSLLIILHEWKYDYHTFADNSWYDMEIIIVDGDRRISKNFKGENDIPDSGAIPNQMQLIYKQRFETVFSNEGILTALRSPRGDAPTQRL